MNKKQYDNVAIVMPAYNEAKVISQTIQGIQSSFKNIIVVDDGSTDNTTKKVLATRAMLVRHPINLGQGAALQTGIEYALLNKSIKYVVTFDSDGQHQIDDVKKMLNKIEFEKLDIVLGSRFLGDTVSMPKLKKIILKTAIKFANLTSGVKLTDTHNGLRVITREAAERLNLQSSDYSHASEIIEKIGKLKLKYEEVPVTIIYTEYSKSKGQSTINAVNIGFDILLDKVIGR